MNTKLITIFIIMVFLNSCKLPWQKEPRSGGSYGGVVRAISPGPNGNFDRVGDFSRTLNDLMSGPTNGMGCNNAPADSDPIFKLGRKAGTTKKIKGEEQVLWNECAGTMTANYGENSRGKLTHYKCSKKRKMSKKFFDFFESNFSSCTKQAFLKVKGQKAFNGIEKISFTHEGVAGDTRHSNKSLHSINRAIDIALINVSSGGKNYSFDVKKQKGGLEKKFFDEFRSCWHRAVTELQGNCTGTSTPVGTIGHEDGHHHNHIHVSLPRCGGGFYSKEDI